jgi:hypothetical protein
MGKGYTEERGKKIKKEMYIVETTAVSFATLWIRLIRRKFLT